MPKFIIFKPNANSLKKEDQKEIKDGLFCAFNLLGLEFKILNQ